MSSLKRTDTSSYRFMRERNQELNAEMDQQDTEAYQMFLKDAVRACVSDREFAHHTKSIKYAERVIPNSPRSWCVRNYKIVDAEERVLEFAKYVAIVSTDNWLVDKTSEDARIEMQRSNEEYARLYKKYPDAYKRTIESYQ